MAKKPASSRKIAICRRPTHDLFAAPKREVVHGTNAHEVAQSDIRRCEASDGPYFLAAGVSVVSRRSVPRM